jgi:hypothetical protein
VGKRVGNHGECCEGSVNQYESTVGRQIIFVFNKTATDPFISSGVIYVQIHALAPGESLMLVWRNCCAYLPDENYVFIYYLTTFFII